jgi:hypothetical protein
VQPIYLLLQALYQFLLNDFLYWFIALKRGFKVLFGHRSDLAQFQNRINYFFESGIKQKGLGMGLFLIFIKRAAYSK